MSALQRLQNHKVVSAPGKGVTAPAIVRPDIVISFTPPREATPWGADMNTVTSCSLMGAGSGCNSEPDFERISGCYQGLA